MPSVALTNGPRLTVIVVDCLQEHGACQGLGGQGFDLLPFAFDLAAQHGFLLVELSQGFGALAGHDVEAGFQGAQVDEELRSGS
ncbi:MAG: hypothetical protein V9F04_08705 [Dermatophilaceae bacterium]